MEDSFLSKKKRIGAIARHFKVMSWKIRHFKLASNGTLIISSMGSLSFDLKFCKTKRHAYDAESYCLSISDSIFEVDIRFPTISLLQLWENSLRKATLEAQEAVRNENFRILTSLSDFIRQSDATQPIYEQQSNVTKDTNFEEIWARECTTIPQLQSHSHYQEKQLGGGGGSRPPTQLSVQTCRTTADNSEDCCSIVTIRVDEEDYAIIDHVVSSSSASTSSVGRHNEEPRVAVVAVTTESTSDPYDSSQPVTPARINNAAHRRKRASPPSPRKSVPHPQISALFPARNRLDSVDCDLWSLPVPHLRIVIMVVGTRGDLQPFMLLAKRLIHDGHRVRLATHACFRSAVEAVATVGVDVEAGQHPLEFYPLGGDPHKLSEFMVKTHGCLLPTTTEQWKQIPAQLAMLTEIIHSCWGACVEPDPEDKAQRRFLADAIIANPVSYAHIHCAEALGIPLHIMFPQPWVPTKAFPHPLACMSYQSQHQWMPENHLSYQVVESMLWTMLGPAVNAFRRHVLGLPHIRAIDGAATLLDTYKVPFAKMWSERLVPRPKDWPEHVDVVGMFFDKAAVLKHEEQESEKVPDVIPRIIHDAQPPSLTSSSSFVPSPDLAQFLCIPSAENGDNAPLLCPSTTFAPLSPPVFVGFGSMVVEQPQELLLIFLEAAAVSNVRLLVQSGWSEVSQEVFRDLAVRAELRAAVLTECAAFDDSSNCGDTNKRDVDKAGEKKRDGWRASRDAFLVGPCPHSWLFRHVTAVIHHGGAGTTAAGLLAGRPTFICPFFGDQHFWGEVVRRNGLGPAPCAVGQLTLSRVAEVLEELTRGGETKQRTKDMSKLLREEDGVAAAVGVFYKRLPVRNMLCDVSLFMGVSRLAQVYCSSCGLKMCTQVSAHLHRPRGDDEQWHLNEDISLHTVTPCAYVDWAEHSKQNTAAGALFKGIAGLMSELAGGVQEVVLQTAAGALQDGLRGGAAGLAVGVKGLAMSPFTGGLVLSDSVRRRSVVVREQRAVTTYGLEVSQWTGDTGVGGMDAVPESRSRSASISVSSCDDIDADHRDDGDMNDGAAEFKNKQAEGVGKGIRHMTGYDAVLTRSFYQEDEPEVSSSDSPANPVAINTNPTLCFNNNVNGSSEICVGTCSENNDYKHSDGNVGDEVYASDEDIEAAVAYCDRKAIGTTNKSSSRVRSVSCVNNVEKNSECEAGVVNFGCVGVDPHDDDNGGKVQYAPDFFCFRDDDDATGSLVQSSCLPFAVAKQDPFTLDSSSIAVTDTVAAAAAAVDLLTEELRAEVIPELAPAAASNMPTAKADEDPVDVAFARAKKAQRLLWDLISSANVSHTSDPAAAASNMDRSHSTRSSAYATFHPSARMIPLDTFARVFGTAAAATAATAADPEYGVLNQSILSFVQALAEERDYLDFTDFSLLYLYATRDNK